VVLGSPSAPRSIFQPRLLFEGENDGGDEAEKEFDQTASVPAERVLLLVQQRRHLASPDEPIPYEEEDDTGIVTEDELFFGSIRDPNMPRASCNGAAAAPLSCPPLYHVQDDALPGPPTDGGPLVAFRTTGSALLDENRAHDGPALPTHAAWDRWIAHYMSCPGAGD
jgi:hypothetical protein